LLDEQANEAGLEPMPLWGRPRRCAAV